MTEKLTLGEVLNIKRKDPNFPYENAALLVKAGLSINIDLHKKYIESLLNNPEIFKILMEYYWFGRLSNSPYYKFILSVLEQDVPASLKNANKKTELEVEEYLLFVKNNFQVNSIGSYENVLTWRVKKGLFLLFKTTVQNNFVFPSPAIEDKFFNNVYYDLIPESIENFTNKLKGHIS